MVSIHFRYRGKKKPHAILAEICWWYKNVYEGRKAEIEAEIDEGAIGGVEEETSMEVDDEYEPYGSESDEDLPKSKRSCF